MRIRFDYNGERRAGELVRLYTARNGHRVAKVVEDGNEAPKSFRVERMGHIESGPRRTDDEIVTLIVKASRAWNDGPAAHFKYDGNPLELVLAAMFESAPLKAIDVAEEAIEAAKLLP